MIGLIGIIALITILALSMLITRLATIALTSTGLSEDAARFQARSAFTGTGFTTREAETVVDHPVRRNIIMILMVIRSAGLISIILSLILSFMGSAPDETLYRRLIILAGSILALLFLSRLSVVNTAVNFLIKHGLRRWADIDLRDYAGLLKLSDGYTVMQMHLNREDWMVDKHLNDCQLRKEGVNILGILRSDGKYVGVPKGGTKMFEGDRLILYGRAGDLKELDRRRKGGLGDVEHEQAVSEQKNRMVQQDKQEKEYEEKRKQ
ncbi:TrkA C-terminal domain-containing protein [bacterium]|nr:TrkA C-terminal domain-containing protein [bacterium]